MACQYLPAPGPPALISEIRPQPSPVHEMVVVEARPIKLRMLKWRVSSCLWPEMHG